MKHLARTVFACVVGALAAVAPCGAAHPAQFPYQKALAAPDEPGKRFGLFALDDALFAATDRAYANMRIYDGTGTETPFLVRARTEERAIVREHLVPTRKVRLDPLPGNQIQIIIERSPSHQAAPSLLELRTTQRDFEKRVSVAGSDDRVVWVPLASDQPVFDYSRYIDIRNVRVEMTARAFRFYRVIIANVTERFRSPLAQILRERDKHGALRTAERRRVEDRDFRIEEIRLFERRETARPGARVTRDYPTHSLCVENRQDRKETRVTFGTDRQPVTALRLLTPTENYSRSVSVEIADREGGPWRRIRTGRVMRVTTGTFSIDQTRLQLGTAVRAAWVRFSIFNEDNPPLLVTGMETEGEVHEVLFLGKPGNTYRVLYGGNPGSKPPSYDIARLVGTAKDLAPCLCNIGPQAPNPDAKRLSIHRLLSGKALLWIAVCAVLVVLMWILVQTTRKVERLPQEPDRE